MKLDALQQAIGHRFTRPELLQQAVTHRSFGSPHNERLEFLGDSIVNCVIAIALFERFGELREGRDDAAAHQPQRVQHLELLDVLGQVARGHALVDVLVPGQRVELLDAGLHVVARHALAGVDRVEVHAVDDGLVGGDHLVGVSPAEVDAQVALRPQHREPELPLRDDLGLRRPDALHLGGGVTGGKDVRHAHEAESSDRSPVHPNPVP